MRRLIFTSGRLYTPPKSVTIRDFRIDPEDQFDPLEGDCLADVSNFLALDDPELTVVNLAPFFSMV